MPKRARSSEGEEGGEGRKRTKDKEGRPGERRSPRISPITVRILPNRKAKIVARRKHASERGRLLGGRMDSTARARRARLGIPAPVFPKAQNVSFHKDPLPTEHQVAEGTVGDLGYTIHRVRDRRWKSFKVDQAAFDVRIRQLKNKIPILLMKDCFEVVYDVLRETVRLMQERYARDDPEHLLGRLTIQSEHLDTAIPGATVALNRKDLIHSVMYNLEQVLTSKQELPLDDTFRVSLTVMNLPPVTFAGRNTKRLGVGLELSSYVSKSRNFTLAPTYAGRLENCCLLTSIVLGKVYNREMRANVGRKKLSNPVTPDWRILKNLTAAGRRGRRAKEHLHALVLEFCRQNSLDLSTWKNIGLDRLEKMRPKLMELGFNLHVHCMQGGYQRIFTSPRTYCAEIETITILAVEAEGEEGLFHCGLIKRPTAFFSHQNFAHCNHCDRRFSSAYARFHRCHGRDSCKLCRRKLADEDDYVDFDVVQDYCFSLLNPTVQLPCEKCARICLTPSCHAEHSKACKKLGHCDDCDTTFQVKANKPHKCFQAFCRQCKTTYDVRGDRHWCQLTPPTPQRRHNRKMVLDLETYANRAGSHQAVAAGVLYETQAGIFDSIYFYDDAMEHPYDGLVVESEVDCQYWPEGRAPIFYSAPQSIKKLYRKPVKQSPGKAEKKKKKKAPVRGDQFLANEAAVDGGYNTEEEEEEEENDADDFLSDGDSCCSDDSGEELGERLVREGEGREEEEEEEEEECLREGSALNKFVDWLLESDRFYGYVICSHHGSGFDTILLQRLLIKKNVAFLPIFDGNKLLHLSIPALKIHFVDTLKYIRMPLAKFPKRFPSMPLCQNKKGTFPYRFIRPENYAYSGETPGEEFFLDRFSSDAAVEETREYLKSQEGKVWHFKSELHKYLRQDILMLLGGVLALTQEYQEFQLDFDKKPPLLFDPFSMPFFTSSSFVHGLFRYYSLEKDKVYLLQNQRNSRRTSQAELEWLEFQSRKRGIKIRHAFNHPEAAKKIGPYSVDGYVAGEEGETVFEFLGCLAHGHHLERDCPLTAGMKPSSPNPWGKLSQSAYNEWQIKKKYLEERNIRVVSIWECEHAEDVEEDPVLQNFLDEYYAEGRPRERLALRQALRGGRTEAFCLLFDQRSQPHLRCFYADKNSLYPNVAIRHKYPVGLPETFIGDKLDDICLDPEKGFFDKYTGEEMMGLVQCTMLPPPSLFIPVLPTTHNGKMKYGLCNMCLKQEKKSCNHEDRDRQMTDTWTSVEILFALECGYKLVKIHEMVLYRESEHLFSEFYTNLAKIKLESEGFPDDAVTEEDKLEYVRQLNEDMPGLNLDPAKVSRNPGRRAFAKDCSNTGLGKFSQDSLRKNVGYASSWVDLAKIKYAPDKELLDVHPITDTLAEYVFVTKESHSGFHRNVQVIVYAFVTAYARVGMARDMRKLQKDYRAHICYTDTDSIIFAVPEDCDMDALEKDFKMGKSSYGAYKYETKGSITSFASLGAKNYSLTTDAGESMTKVRGFTLRSAQARNSLNHEVMKSFLLDMLHGVKRFTVSESFSMKVDRRTQTVKNIVLRKKYTNQGFDKRWIPEDCGPMVRSEPFGAKHSDYVDLA